MNMLFVDEVAEPLQIEDEPDLEIALPHVFTQPPLTTLQRGKLPHLELRLAKMFQASVEPHAAGGLGPDYQALINEFQPLFTWAMACWDYLLSTEGPRFVPRHGEERQWTRGDYRAFTDRDFSRLVHRVFRDCAMEFAHTPVFQSFSSYLRRHLWIRVVEAYHKLNEPLDPRQRFLTAYSYLRCVPYRFLNDFHEELVARVMQQRPRDHVQALDVYFLRFFTLPATASELHVPVDEAERLLRQGLVGLLMEERLVYCLLRQIERY